MKVVRWNSSKWHAVFNERRRDTQCGRLYPVDAEIKEAHWPEQVVNRCWRCFD